MQAAVQYKQQYSAGRSTVQAAVQCRQEYSAGSSTVQAGVQCRQEYSAGSSASSNTGSSTVSAANRSVFG